MASDRPGWCKNCGQPLDHAERPQGRAKQFCDATCRQGFHRDVALRRSLGNEVGMTAEQIERLLALYRVSPRAKRADHRRTTRTVTEAERDGLTSRN